MESKRVVSLVFSGYHDKSLLLNRVVPVVAVVALFSTFFVVRRILFSL